MGRGRHAAAAAIRHAKLEEARQYIAAHFAERMTLTRMAAAVHLSRIYFHRQFAAAYGMSPKRYRTECQIEDVKRRMLRGQPLREIAAASGFGNQAHMTRRFRKFVGETPLRWLARWASAGPHAAKPGDVGRRSLCRAAAMNLEAASVLTPDHLATPCRSSGGTCGRTSSSPERCPGGYMTLYGS